MCDGGAGNSISIAIIERGETDEKLDLRSFETDESAVTVIELKFLISSTPFAELVERGCREGRRGSCFFEARSMLVLEDLNDSSPVGDGGMIFTGSLPVAK